MAEENKQAQQPQQDIGELLKIRREKLSALQEEGNDPFVITKYYPSQCGNQRKF